MHLRAMCSVREETGKLIQRQAPNNKEICVSTLQECQTMEFHHLSIYFMRDEYIMDVHCRNCCQSLFIGIPRGCDIYDHKLKQGTIVPNKRDN